MSNNFKIELDNFIDDWYWDGDSEFFALEMGKFLFAFMLFLDKQKLSKRTINNHKENVYWIGIFEVEYGYNEEFFPEVLEDGPNFIYEFERKISDSKYAIQSYESTWRKLDKFIKSGEYKRYLTEIQNKLAKKE